MLNRYLIIFVLALVLTSCDDKGVIFQETKEISGAEWNKDAPVSFDFPVKDSTKAYDFFMELRTTTAYEWSNLFVFVEIEFPNGQRNVDTVEFILADKTGKWSGQKSGSMVDNDMMFIHNLQIKDTGTYTLEFTQAMRQDILYEVSDVGLKIKETGGN